jgi:hypothetical protein
MRHSAFECTEKFRALEWGAKEGIRLWWWLEDGVGHNATRGASQAEDENEQRVHGGRLESARAKTSMKRHCDASSATTRSAESREEL